MGALALPSARRTRYASYHLTYTCRLHSRGSPLSVVRGCKGIQEVKEVVPIINRRRVVVAVVAAFVFTARSEGFRSYSTDTLVGWQGH